MFAMFRRGMSFVFGHAPRRAALIVLFFLLLPTSAGARDLPPRNSSQLPPNLPQAPLDYSAPYFGNETMVTPNDGTLQAEFGHAFAMALEGNVAAFGAPRAQKAYVFRFNGSTWVQEAEFFIVDSSEPPFTDFGQSVALSGNTVVVGAPEHNGKPFTQTGGVFVYVYDGTQWNLQATLVPDDAFQYCIFGGKVAITGDTLVASGCGALGSAYVYQRSGTSWIQQAKLGCNLSSGTAGAVARSPSAFYSAGSTVRIEGNTVIVSHGYTYIENIQASVCVFQRSGTTWSQQATLVASDSQTTDDFGRDTAISGDTVVVGAPGADGRPNGAAGTVYVFTNNGGTWTQSAKLSLPDPDVPYGGTQYGSSVALRGDLLLVGRMYGGAVDVYARADTAWVRQQRLFQGNTAQGGTNLYGRAVATDGTRLLVGNDFASGTCNCGSGAVFVYNQVPPPPPPTPPWLEHSSWPDNAEPDSAVAKKFHRQLLSLAEPVNPVSGNFTYSQVDLELPGFGVPVRFERSYDSALPTDSAIGFGWNTTYNWSLSFPDASTVKLKRGNGRIDAYTVSGGNLIPPSDVVDPLVKNGDGSYALSTRELLTFQFNAAGRLVSIADLDGNSNTLTYNGSNQWTGISDAAARNWTLTYNGGGRIASVTDPAGRTMQYGYDGSGNLTTVTNPAGGVTTYGYDANHRLTTMSDARGVLMMTNVYDALGRVVQQSDPRGTHRFGYLGIATVYTDTLGVRTISTYDANHNLLARVDGVGSVNAQSAFGYNAQGLVSSETHPGGSGLAYAYDARRNTTVITDTLGNITHRVYDNRDLIQSQTDANNRTTTFVYDSKAHLTSLADAAGNTTTYTYTPKGQLATTTDPLGKTTTYGYDAFGNRTSITDPLGKVTTFTYDSAGRVTSITDPLGHSGSTTFNALNLPLTRTAADGGVTTYSYDAVDNLLSARDPLNNTTTFAYNAAGDLTTTTDPLNNTTTFSYDAMGRLVQRTLPDGTRWTNTLDALGRLTQLTSPLGVKTKYAYDAGGNLKSVTDPAGATYAYTYDLDERLIVVTDPLGGKTSYTYDKVGNLTASQNTLTKTTSYSYDALNRLTSITDPLYHSKSYTYDALGRLTAVYNGTGQVVNYTYDPLGRMLTATDRSANIAFAYDAAGNRTVMTDTLGTTTYAYDAVNRLTAVNGPQGAISYTYDVNGRRTALNQPGANLTYTYDADSRLTAVKKGTSTLASYGYDMVSRNTSQQFGNGAATTLSYDIDGRLTGLVTNGPGGVLQDIRYTLDGRGFRTGESGSNMLAGYNYDALGRLSSATILLGAVRTTYLPLILSNAPTSNVSTRTSVPTPQLPSAVSTGYGYGYTYDSEGNRLSSTENGVLTTYTYNAANQIVTAGGKNFTYDNAGRLTSDGTSTYAYDAWDHLTSVSGPLAASYAYDGDDNRVSETVGGASKSFLLDIADPLPLRIASTSNSGTERYFYGLGQAAQQMTDDSLRYDHDDGLGSLRLLTNASGGVIDRMNYAPFGQRLSGNSGMFGFTGEPYTLAEQLVHLRARDYSPSLGRFLTPDPPLGSLFDSQAKNLYPYAKNNPVNYVDPSGKCIPICLIAAIAVVAVGVAVVEAVQHHADPPAPQPHQKPSSPKPPKVDTAIAPPPTGENKGGGTVVSDLGAALTNKSKDNGSALANKTHLITSDGGGLITSDGASLITSDGAGLQSKIGANVLSTYGNEIISSNASKVIGDNGIGLYPK